MLNILFYYNYNMVLTFRKSNHKTLHKTYRQKVIHGGTIETVEQVIRETPADGIRIINPESKFVVATYWWGKANMNRNLQYPCPEDIQDMAREEALVEISKKSPFPAWVTKTATNLKKVMERRSLTEGEKNTLGSLKTVWNEWKARVLSTEENKLIIKETYDRVLERQKTKPEYRPVRSFPDMIEEWESKCKEANVNYVALNTEFDRSDYQNGINGKPLFIKKILDAVKPRGVLYIDGDMWMHKYPAIFDIDNVDFMARGWNMDPRSKAKSLETPFYDPYTFETSGGTMYFGNTERARQLLDKWFTESTRPEQKGKADDRILSQVFTTESYVVGTNIINLPLEYLWLTDIYKGFLKDSTSASSIEDVYIEHPYCLTGEERATDQGAAANRTPENYDEEVIDNINYKRPPETFYEYIYFDGNEEMRNGFGRYLKYMKDAKSGFTNQPMMNIIDFASKYGEYNEIATRNLEGIVESDGQGEKVSLPLTATIPEILKALFAGSDVELGGPIPGVEPEDEVVATDASTNRDGLDMYTRAIQVDTTSPMFLSGKSKVLRHLLAMCETLADINKHSRSYMFLSRIRWNMHKGGVATEVVAGQPLVHQIWFGGELPEWRKYIFDANKAMCEANGYTYRLWKNEDRTNTNFPSTIQYQNAAIEKGREIGQNRWAQVADLARLEIVYMNGGIYIDSLIEISPALLAAVSNAFATGSDFIGCNEDPCTPPTDCIGHRGNAYLTNSFFAANKFSPVLERLLDDTRLSSIDFDSEFINRTTGPYYLRSGIKDVTQDNVFMFDSAQIYQFNQQDTPYKEATPNIFLSKKEVPGSIKIRDDMYFIPGGIHVLQNEFLVIHKKQEALMKAAQLIAPTIVDAKGPLATYHSGLGGTWST